MSLSPNEIVKKLEESKLVVQITKFTEKYKESVEQVDTYRKLLKESPKDEEFISGLSRANQALQDLLKYVFILGGLIEASEQKTEKLEAYNKKMERLDDLKQQITKVIAEFKTRIINIDKEKLQVEDNAQSGKLSARDRADKMVLLDDSLYSMKELIKFAALYISNAIGKVEEMAANSLGSDDRKRCMYDLFVKQESGKNFIVTQNMEKELKSIFSQNPLPDYITQDQLIRFVSNYDLSAEFLKNENVMNRMLYGNGDEGSVQKGRNLITQICKGSSGHALMKNENYLELKKYQETPQLFDQNLAKMKAQQEKPKGLFATLTSFTRKNDSTSDLNNTLRGESPNGSMKKMLTAGIVGSTASTDEKKVAFKDTPLNETQSRALDATAKEAPTFSAGQNPPKWTASGKRDFNSQNLGESPNQSGQISHPLLASERRPEQKSVTDAVPTAKNPVSSEATQQAEPERKWVYSSGRGGPGS